MPAISRNRTARILLVDDDDAVRDATSILLNGLGIEVVIAVNGREGVDLAMSAESQGTPFQVILMDMRMPVLDGYAATATLRTNGYLGPIIAVTGDDMPGDRERCLAAGCNEYITKPTVPSRLLDMIETCLAIDRMK